MKNSLPAFIFLLAYSAPLFAQNPSDLTLFYEAGDAHEAMYFFDVTGDASEDLITVGAAGIGIYEVLPGGQFERRQKLTETLTITPLTVQGATKDYSFDLTTHDLDNDGDADLLTVRNFNGQPHLVWYENTGGTEPFGSVQAITMLDGPEITDLTIGDFDGNGVPDFAIYFNAGLPVYVYALGVTGNLPVVDNTSTLVYDELNRLYTNDLDNDGDQDLLYSALDDKRIGWYENLGNAIFNPYDVLANDAVRVLNVEVADLDNDGDKDLVATLRDLQEVVWFEQTGPGMNFSDRISLATISRIFNSKVFDFDDDGFPDILAQSYDLVSPSITDNPLLSYHLLLNENGDAGFSAGPQTVSFKGFRSEADVDHLETRFIQDIDGDNDLDLFFYNYNDESISWAENTDGWTDSLSFSAEILDVYFADYQYAELEDVDDNGQLDLVVGSFDSDSRGQLMIALQQNGPQYFDIQTVYGEDGPQTLNQYHNRGFFADMDGDGDQDVIGGVTDHLVFSENNGSAFSPFQFVFARDKSLDVGDVDNDGAPEALAVKDNSNQVSIVKAVSSDPVNLASYNFYSVNKNNEVHFGDINNDGALDFIIKFGSGPSSELVAFINQGDGSAYDMQEVYLESFPGYTGIGLLQIELVDFDDDNDLDVVAYYKDPWVGQDNSNNIAWIENQGNGNWGTRTILFTEADSDTWTYVWDKFEAEDLDGDGDKDFIIEGFDGKVACFENLNGLPELGSGVILFNDAVNYTYLGVKDTDGDSDLDFIIGSASESKIYILDNDGFSFDEQFLISGQVYMDLNENGQFDPDEFLYLNNEVSSDPSGLINFSDEGLFGFSLPNGNYDINLDVPDNWQAVTPPTASYNVDVAGANIDTLHFGISPLEIVYQGEVDLWVNDNICNSIAGGQLTFQNTSTVPVSGWLSLEWHPLYTLTEASLPPDSMATNTWLWEAENIPPGHTFTIDFAFMTPDESNTGQYVFFEGMFAGYDDDDQFLFSEEDLEGGGLLCAYDPNDKQVLPIRDTIAHYIVYEDTLEYTVRFQNTGNLPATDVVIRDTLDPHLDWMTFQPRSASHDYTLTLNTNTGEVIYSFLGIMLPDSVNNEPESHGFLRFTIQPAQDAPEGTVLTNRAAIYFDQNAPIITNTVFNTLVSEPPFTGNCTFEPEITSSQSAINGQYCPGMIELIAGAGDTYQWYSTTYPAATGGIPIGGNSQQIQIDVGANSGLYFYCEVTIDNCTDVSNLILVEEYLLPDIPFVDPDIPSPICFGDTLLLEVPDSVFVNLQWYVNGQLIPGATGNTLEVYEEGQYSVAGSFAACPDNFLDIVSFELLEVVIHHDGEVGFQVSDTTLTADAGYDAYQWYLNGTPIPGANNQMLEISEDGFYAVELTDQYGCSFWTMEIFITLSSTGEAVDNSLEWYPNPVGEVLHIRSASTVQQVVVYTLEGRIIERSEDIRQTDFVVHTHGWSKGLYVAKVQLFDGSVSSFYFIKQ